MALFTLCCRPPKAVGRATMTTPNALQVITEVTARSGGKILMGVGTVLDPETCRAAILAGAEFVVTPVTKPEVIRLSNRYGKPIMLTPRWRGFFRGRTIAD